MGRLGVLGDKLSVYAPLFSIRQTQKGKQFGVITKTKMLKPLKIPWAPSRGTCGREMAGWIELPSRTINLLALSLNSLCLAAVAGRFPCFSETNVGASRRITEAVASPKEVQTAAQTAGKRRRHKPKLLRIRS